MTVPRKNLLPWSILIVALIVLTSINLFGNFTRLTNSLTLKLSRFSVSLNLLRIESMFGAFSSNTIRFLEISFVAQFF